MVMIIEVYCEDKNFRYIVGTLLVVYGYCVSIAAPMVLLLIQYVGWASKIQIHGLIIPADGSNHSINASSLDKIYFTGDYLRMVALTEAVTIGKTFDGMKDYQIHGNKEMVALGTMNIVGSMTPCYVARCCFSRSVVNYMPNWSLQV